MAAIALLLAIMSMAGATSDTAAQVVPQVGSPGGTSSALLAAGVAEDSDVVLGASYETRRLVQGAFVRRVTLGSVSVRRALRGEALLKASLLGWVDGGTPLGGGVLAAESGGRGGRGWAMEVSHAPVWRQGGGGDPLRAIRVLDLRQLDHGLAATEVRGAVALGPGGAALRMEAGGTRMSDGNARAFAFGRLRLLTMEWVGVHFAVEPNGYVEGFSGTTRGLLTPTFYASLGGALEWRAAFGAVLLNGSVNPHWYLSHTRTDFGVEGAFAGSLALGVVRLEAEAAVYGHGGRRVIQGTAGLSAPVG